MQSFRTQHNLSPQELNAFLYNFSLKNITHPDPTNLPTPSRVWFVIAGVGGNGDFEYLNATESDSVSHWQGNLETRRGDIVILWCASPRSYLHSIWRATSDGFNDPYFYYYTAIRIGSHVKIPPISFADFAKHPQLGSTPAVRARFQGRSGTAISAEDYSSILGILKQKGFDTALLPASPEAVDFCVAGINNERDVEFNLLEPLLKRLGYTETEWVRQLSIRMGRGERNFPDYVLGCEPILGEERGIAVIECKFEIASTKDLKEAFIQAKSYALRLQASILSLAARRGLWIFTSRVDGFSIEHFIFKTWSELAHPDELHDISQIFGKSAINKLLKQRHKVRKK